MSDHVDVIQGHPSSSELIQDHLMSPIVTRPDTVSIDQIIGPKNENTKLFLPMEQRRRLALMISAGKKFKECSAEFEKIHGKRLCRRRYHRLKKNAKLIIESNSNRNSNMSYTRKIPELEILKKFENNLKHEIEKRKHLNWTIPMVEALANKIKQEIDYKNIERIQNIAFSYKWVIRFMRDHQLEW